MGSFYRRLLLMVWISISEAFKVDVNGTLLRCETHSDVEHVQRDPEYFHTVDDCHRKIRLVLNILNSEKTPEGEEYILIGDIYDPEIKSMVRLLNPITVMLRQEQVLLAYPFHFLTAVNGKASEIVVNYENKKNFTGCDDKSPVHPTCGFKYNKGSAVPFSQGFCCRCSTSGKQMRGGQDCSITTSPSEDIDLDKYKSSAHCLLFHDIWYTVNELSIPAIEHTVYIQVFNRRELSNGSTTWVDLTQGEEFTIGTQNPYQFDENKTIVATYITERPGNGTVSISYGEKRLLMPQPQPEIEHEKLHTAVKNGAKDYILLSKNKIDSSGHGCDKAGVSYEAFSKQDDRCNVARNSCLTNQPLDYWEEDDKRRKSGEKGTNLLEFFGTPYKEPILVNDTTHEHWLVLEYYTKHLSVIYIELNADNIIALRAGYKITSVWGIRPEFTFLFGHSMKYAQIASVVTTSSSAGIEFHISIINAGLVSSEFSVQVVRCSYDVPDSKVESSVITAQGKHDFVANTMYGNIEVTDEFTCVVEASSTLHGIIAMREVSVKPGKRCVCYIHCKCRCLGGSMKCESMDEKLYHLAGFRGSLPVLSAKPPHKSWFRKHPIIATFTVLATLLFFGCLKAGLGLLGYSVVGDFGLKPCLFRPKKIGRYYDPDLKDVEVLYDEEEYPIHPDTRQRSKVISGGLQLFLNALFCFIWPCILISGHLEQKRKAAAAAAAANDTEGITENGDEMQDSIVMSSIRETKAAEPSLSVNQRVALSTKDSKHVIDVCRQTYHHSCKVEEEELISLMEEDDVRRSHKRLSQVRHSSEGGRRLTQSDPHIRRSKGHSLPENVPESEALENEEDSTLGPLSPEFNKRFRKGVTKLGAAL